jgi:hypothetical protein
LADCARLHRDFCSVSDAHILRRKRFLFKLGQFFVVAECIANSDARHCSFAIAHSNAHQQRYSHQSG